MVGDMIAYSKNPQNGGQNVQAHCVGSDVSNHASLSSQTDAALDAKASLSRLITYSPGVARTAFDPLAVAITRCLTIPKHWSSKTLERSQPADSQTGDGSNDHEQ